MPLTAALPATRPPESRRRDRIVVGTLAFATATAALQQSVVVPLLPRLQADLRISVTAVTWTLTVSLLVGAVTTPLLSRFGDMYGRRRMIMIALVLLTAGSVLSAVSSSLPVLIAGRLLQGASIALVPLSIGVVRDVLPLRELPTAIGVLSATLGFGSGGGMILAGLSAGDYHAAFWTTAALAVVATVLVAVLVKDVVPAVGGRPDLPGAMLLTIALIASLLAISQGRSWGWGSWQVLTLIAVFAVASVAWVLVERRTADPLVEIPMLTHRGTVGATIASFLLGFALFSSMTAISPFVQAPVSTGYGFGASTLQVGFYLLPTTLLMLVVSLFAGRLMRRFPAASLVTVGAVLVALADVWFLVSHTRHADAYVMTTLLGAGVGLGYAALGTMAVEHVDQGKTSVASGVNVLVRMIGASVAGSVVGAVLGGHTSGGAFPSVQGYLSCFALAAVVAGLAAVSAATFGVMNRRLGRA
ncbi:MFS transporter [Sphaerisporangium corydalis]|uniref:MFS transporter n=1 Tax=Sphaerisporangium corydalis TaxID=1441875 RepID=A0ABV9ELJ5_9ACTN|nr:MFS transporter [Sphaerisporangium corydalis]